MLNGVGSVYLINVVFIRRNICEPQIVVFTKAKVLYKLLASVSGQKLNISTEFISVIRVNQMFVFEWILQ